MMSRSYLPVRLLAFALAAAMVLGGCGESAAPKDTPTPTPTAAPTASPEPESPNFYKYNTYLETLDYLYDNVSYLDHYFAVVAYQEEFAVLDGGEYGDLQISVGTAVGDYLSRLDTCLELAEEEPSYPEMDAAIKALVPLAKENEQALLDIASYARSGDWREDNLERAAQLHAALLPTIDPFMAALADAQVEMDRLDESFQDEELARMRENGEMIAYYSNILLNDTVDFYTLACAEGNISAEQIIPMNMDELSAAAARVKETGALLLEALEDKSERGRTVKLDYMNEDDLKFQYYRSYQTHVNGILHYVEEAMTYAGQGGDISGSLEFVEMNYSELISDYNDCIVG